MDPHTLVGQVRRSNATIPTGEHELLRFMHERRTLAHEYVGYCKRQYYI
jgi:hypothetical protein